MTTASIRTRPSSNGATADREIQWIRVADMFVDHQYQRNVNERMVEKIVKRMDPALLGTLVVNERETGKVCVIDGQHRLLALRELGVKTTLCEVMCVSEQEEARIFVDLQVNRRPVKPEDRHRAKLFQQDPQAVELEEGVTAAGFKISLANNLNALRCVAALEDVQRDYGIDTLVATLTLISQAWDGGAETSCRKADMIKGIAMFLHNHGDDIGTGKRYDKLVQKLRVVHPAKVARTASEHSKLVGGTSAKMVAREIREIYNAGRRHDGSERLSAGKLGGGE